MILFLNKAALYSEGVKNFFEIFLVLLKETSWS